MGIHRNMADLERAILDRLHALPQISEWSGRESGEHTVGLIFAPS